MSAASGSNGFFSLASRISSCLFNASAIFASKEVASIVFCRWRILLQEGLQRGDDVPLAADGGREFAAAKARLGLDQHSVDLLLLHHLHGLGGLPAHVAGEVNRLTQTLLELPEAGGDVALVFEGGQVQFRTAIGRFAGHGLRLLADFRLMLDELLDLAGQLGDLQPPQQDLLFDLDPHEDFPALGPGRLKGHGALRRHRSGRPSPGCRRPPSSAC